MEYERTFSWIDRRSEEISLRSTTNFYLFKVNNRNTKKKFEICPKLTINQTFVLVFCSKFWTYFTPFRRSTLVGQRPMKSLSSLCPSVLLSLNFHKIGSLVFSDNWPWYLVTGDARFLTKEFGPIGPKSSSKWGFSPFSQVRFISFPLTCIGW